MNKPVVRKLRCAVYTRKSSEEGLEQEFNSLHAQREACESYIASQRSEGWVLVREQYDDGGISGGTLERPGLKRLLADIEDGLVDVVVVYKIDRLSRSLMDFSKLVEVFDRNGVTFVSVTQSFNTTTSMGRLTLNILLSFAQFEREVTAERIRDKVRASRMKGMWMGGCPPLGYEVKNRKLVENPADAAHVRWVFARFIDIGSGTLLARELAERGVTTSRGHRIDKKFIYRMLNNRVYVGEPGDRLLVIAPKNAFAAWDEQIATCLPTFGQQFVRLRKTDKIPLQLLADPKLMIIGYQQLARVKEVIANHLVGRRVHVFLDESHRIKGQNNISTDAVLSFSHLPASKLVMSGTPMPQSTSDLLPQFLFLYPEVQANEDTVVDLISPVYVRTNKNELNLPPVTRVLKTLPMDPLQQRLYELMKSALAREAAQALTIKSKQAFRGLGRSVTRVLQFVSNPALLAHYIAFAHSNELSMALAEGRGPKLRYVLQRTRSLAREGKKVLIWSTFVENVEHIATSLQDLGAVYIHGGVDACDENDDETREGKIRLFHDDPNVMVMVANPAAAGEGISLHTVCHHAIYLDRNYNAAQYLQSEDRIHRLGLPPDQDTTIEIVECAGSVDESVRQRLEFKVGQMAAALNDSGLKISPVPIVPDDEDEGYGAGGLDEGDVRALLAALGG